MPTYQYRCTECGRTTEAVQAFTDPSLTECPHCGGLLRKVYGAVGVVFKGSGFYRNDSRGTQTSSESGGDAGKKKEPAGTKSESGSSGSGSSGSDSGSSGSGSSGSGSSGSGSSGSGSSGSGSSAGGSSAGSTGSSGSSSSSSGSAA